MTRAERIAFMRAVSIMERHRDIVDALGREFVELVQETRKEITR